MTSAPVREGVRQARSLAPGVLLDGVVGRVTMYRLVTLVLLGIAVVAVGCSLVGLLAFPPVGLLAALAVAVVVSLAVNLLAARLRGLRPHTESGLITGLLAFFLFLPLPTVQALGAIALAVTAANLSKYVLVVRGRHVLNPVAVGAVVVLLTGLSGATWWVATPVLLPFVLVGGALVVRRAGAWDLALPVLAVAVPGTALRLLATGSAPGAAVWTAIASYPFPFLAAFLLSEPLTAPPRRWQRILIGALVGVLALLPVRVGWVGMTPEIALVLANVVAFRFGQRRSIRLVLEQRTEHPGGVLDLRFAGPLRIRPGQYVELSLPHRGQDARGVRRAFSPASAPGDGVRILTRQAQPASSFKRTLTALPIGAVVAGSAVAGDFLPPADRTLPVLWLASGIGVTPFLAMAEAEPERDAVLVWRLGADDDPSWAAEALRGVRVLVIGRPAGPLPERWQHLGERMTADGLLGAVPDVAGRRAYAAGSAAWVAAAGGTARRLGLSRIRTDRFLGY